MFVVVGEKILLPTATLTTAPKPVRWQKQQDRRAAKMAEACSWQVLFIIKYTYSFSDSFSVEERTSPSHQ
jgi:hypothetical protein